MDINLPLILMIAVFVTGVVWFWDWLFAAKQRNHKIARIEQRFEHLSEEQKIADKNYLAERELASKEPIVVEYSKSFFPILAIVFVLRSFIVEPFKIPSESMVPTLEVGDFIVVNKFAYGLRMPVFGTKIMEIGQPKRGDVVVFFPPHEERYFIKRLIGLPGDTIQLVDNVVHVNGVPLDQKIIGADTKLRRESVCAASYTLYNEKVEGKEHLMRNCPTGGRRWQGDTWTVPQGEYFMMGDNRDNSQDSRVWGTVPDKNIVGKAFAVWMHWSEGLPSFARAGAIK